MASDIPEINVAPARRSFWQRASVVWLVPIIGLVVALGVAWQSWSSQGPLVTIIFDEALGVSARDTELRYRDVVVGRVESVEFTDDLGQVRVSVRVGKTIAPYIDEDAAFWVVRPEVSARGVTGLDTVLSGVFIEGVWDQSASGFVAEHTGLDSAPLLRPGQRGTLVTLRAQEGTTLTEGTAITYKGIEVGRIGKPRILIGQRRAEAPAAIFAPYDRLLSSTTRFWDTSGFSFTLGTGGASLDFTSLASLVAGGIAFDTMVSGGVPLRGRPNFDIYASEAGARDALFEERRGNTINLSMVFEENATGLVVGAPVQFNGIEVGQVTDVSGIVDPLRFRDGRVRLQVVTEVAAAPLGLAETASAEMVMDFFAAQVESGLRARLATASILTGDLKVELVTLDDVPTIPLDIRAEPFPAVPTTQSQIADAGATAQGVLERINNLPVEEVMASAINFLDASTILVSNGELAQIPGDLRGILQDVERISGSEDVQNAPQRLTGILETVNDASQGLARLVASIETARAVDRMLAAIDAAGSAADTVSNSVADVPELVSTLTDTAKTARDLPLEELVASISGIVTTADELLQDPGTQQLPATLSASLAELRLVLTDLREGGAVENLNQSLAAAQAAADAVAESATALPALVNRLNSVLDSAENTLSSYDDGSEIARSARQALNEVTRAARAIESLSRTIERQPNSLLLGR